MRLHRNTHLQAAELDIDAHNSSESGDSATAGLMLQLKQRPLAFAEHSSSIQHLGDKLHLQ